MTLTSKMMHKYPKKTMSPMLKAIPMPPIIFLSDFLLKFVEALSILNVKIKIRLV